MCKWVYPIFGILATVVFSVILGFWCTYVIPAEYEHASHFKTGPCYVVGYKTIQVGTIWYAEYAYSPSPVGCFLWSVINGEFRSETMALDYIEKEYPKGSVFGDCTWNLSDQCPVTDPPTPGLTVVVAVMMGVCAFSLFIMSIMCCYFQNKDT